MGVGIEQLDRIEGILAQILANQLQFLDDIIRGGDDMASDRISLENIQKFALLFTANSSDLVDWMSRGVSSMTSSSRTARKVIMWP